MKYIHGIYIFFLMTILAFSDRLNAQIQNLIVNPGAEMPIIDPSWEVAEGKDGMLQGSGSPGSIYPKEGNHFFQSNGGDAEIFQDIDLTKYAAYIDKSLMEFTYSGYAIVTFPAFSDDTARQKIEYLDAENIVLASYEKTVRSNYWTLISDSRIAPVGTRTIRIWLKSLEGGVNPTFNAAHDNLSLTFSVNDTIKNKALQFNDNSYVTLEPAAINNLSQGTIETWVYLKSRDQEIISSKQHNDTNSYSIFSIGSYAVSSGQLAKGDDGIVYYHPKNNVNLLSSDIALDIGKWYHLAITFNTSGATLYINGEKHGNTTGDFSIPDDISFLNLTRLGYWDGDGDGYLNGILDEYRIWNTQRTEQQIEYNMYADVDPNSPDLMLYYKMNDSFNSSIIIDSSSKKLNGILGLPPENPIFVPSNIPLKQYQTISFEDIPDKQFGSPPFPLHASASSDSVVTFKVLSGPASISKDTLLTIHGAEDITIQAKQAGSDKYYADSVIQTFSVIKAIQNITITAKADNSTNETRYILTGKSSVGLPVDSFKVTDNGKVTGNILTFTGSGIVIVTAVQTGNDYYEAATADDTTCVAPIQPTEIKGFSQTCPLQQEYHIAAVNGVNYTWVLSGGGTLNTTSGASVLVIWNTIGTYTLTVTASTECVNTTYSISKTVQVVDNVIPDKVSNMYPPAGTVISQFPFSVSWKPGDNTELYDVYVWEQEQQRPENSLAANISQIGFLIQQQWLPNFATGKTYKWQVIAKNGCDETESDIQTFVVDKLANLIVVAVNIDDSVFSGQDIDISAEIKNVGEAPTTAGIVWQDAFYLTALDTLDAAFDIFLGAKPNIKRLMPGETYTTEFKARLPEDKVGEWFIIAKTNAYKNITELISNDNTKDSSFEITQSDLPDLEVEPESVSTTTDAFSGEQIPLTYKIKNVGEQTVNDSVWTDAVYLSPGKDFVYSEAIKLLEINHFGKLAKDEFYSIDTTVLIPQNILGNYYIHVQTDAYAQVYESTAEGNNIGTSELITIKLTPPPDFIVTFIDKPAVASPGEIITVNYTVQNGGASKPPLFGNVWTDNIYISNENVLDTKAVLLSSVHPFPVPAMNSGEEYNNSVNIRIPADFSGPAFIYVYTDARDEVFEYYRNDNNISKSAIEIKAPDLIVDSPVLSVSTVKGGDFAEVYWEDKNIGTGNIFSVSRRDVIWLSPSLEFDSSTAVEIGSVSYNSTMDTGAAIANQASIQFADSLSGQYYFFIQADRDKNIAESREDNNLGNAIAVYINESPGIDLNITNLNVSPSTVIAGNNYTVTYTVINSTSGNIIGKTWSDAIYKSTESIWDSNAIKIKDIPQSRSLSSNTSYTQTISFTTPISDFGIADTIKRYFFVHTDIYNDVYERNAENNNIKGSNLLTITHNPYPDLAVLTAAGADSVMSGKLTTIQWSVTNKNGTEGFSPYWYDAVLFSKDQVQSDDDIIAASKLILAPLAAGKTYSQIMNIMVPNGLSGPYYMLLITDYTHLNKDTDRINNLKVITTSVGGGGGISDTVLIALSPSANLVADTFFASQSGYPGQAVKAGWKVSNMGDTATGNAQWTDYVYLSQDDEVNAGDILLGSFVRKEDIQKGASYTRDSALVFLPSTVTGNYFLLFKTDGSNNIYEHEAEDDNTATSYIFISQQQPCDLTVSSVLMPSSAMVSDSIDVSWKLSNTGINPAIGYLRQGIYISKDSVFDKNDLMLSDSLVLINTSPLADSVFSQKIQLKIVQPGDNFLIVQTDLLNSISELNENNNTAISIKRISISVPDLPLNRPTPAILNNYQELYYKLDIPDSLAGETILVSLSGDELNALNELYIKFDSLPTRINHDFDYDKSVSGSQQIVIPEASKGTYYILAYGASAAVTMQNITLLAQRIDFTILDVNAKEGGNTGTVTVKISGAKFDANMLAILKNDQATYTALKITYINSTSIYATFDLNGAEKGVYDISLIKPGIDTATVKDGFAIVEGSGGGITGGVSGSGLYCYIVNDGVEELLGTAVNAPNSVRAKQAFAMTLIFENRGNIDISLPQLYIESLSNAPVASSEVELALSVLRLLLEILDTDGPDPGILRPGAVFSKKIYSKLPFTGISGTAIYEYQLSGN